MPIYTTPSAMPNRPARSATLPQVSTSVTQLQRLAAFIVMLLATGLLSASTSHAQGGGGGGTTTTAPAASASIKRMYDKSDPLAFLLERKKPLELNKALEDSLKLLRKEMQRMQEVIYKDLDKAATVKEQGQLPSPTVVLGMTKESESRVKDIQSAYRDRARAMLSERQTVQADSLEVIWRRGLPRAEPLQTRRPPTRN